MHLKYIRVGRFPIGSVLPFVFTRKVRKELALKGHDYNSPEWKGCSRRLYPVQYHCPGKWTEDGGLFVEHVTVPMGSHRYQLFAERGVVCERCGLQGKFFALEKFPSVAGHRYHFNLYGYDKNGKEVMLTKDHVHPRSKGGPSRLENYQVLCERCNRHKADRVVK